MFLKITLQSVFPFCVLFLLFQFQQVISTSPSIMMIDDNGYCEFSDAEEDFCASYCYKSVKGPLAYIIELKEELRATKQKHLDREQEIDELKRKSSNRVDNRQLSKAIEDLRYTIVQQNKHFEEIENLKREIENLKGNLSREKATRDTAVNLDLESKGKELTNYQINLKKFNNEIKELKAQVSSYKKKLEEYETELINKQPLFKSNHNEKDNIVGKQLPKTSCQGLSSGIHMISIYGLDSFAALCNGDIDDGGWIVIHKRFDGSENFNRTWAEYRNGFGKLDGEFFIGLQKLHRITNSQFYELFIKMEDINGSNRFASYNNFLIGNEDTNYKLESVGEFKGSASNLMSNLLKQKFTTFDQDNDQSTSGNCATNFGAWWHKRCGFVYLNARHNKTDKNSTWEGIMSWDGLTLKSVQMLIRPKS